MNGFFVDKTLHCVTFVACGDVDRAPTIFTLLLHRGEFSAFRYDSPTDITPESILKLVRNSRTSDVIFILSSAPSLLLTADATSTAPVASSASLAELGERYCDAAICVSQRQRTCLSGGQLAAAMQVGEGVLFVDADYAALSVCPSYSCGTTAERLGNIVATLASTAAAASPSSDFADVSFAHQKKLAAATVAAPIQEAESRFERIRETLLTSCLLDRTQMPARIVPLRLGPAAVADRQQRIIGTVLDRLCSNIPGLAEFLAMPDTVFVGADDASSVQGGGWNWRRSALSPQATPGHKYPVMWARDSGVCLFTLSPRCVASCRMLVELFNARPTIEALGSNCGVTDLNSAAAYIEGRPLPMLRDRGIGSFAVALKGGVHVGITGLILRPEFAPLLDLGFGFLPSVHGKGVARAASSLTLVWAQTVLQQPTVMAVTRETNLAAQKLLARLGFRKERSFEGWGTTQQSWRLDL